MPSRRSMPGLLLLLSFVLLLVGCDLFQAGGHDGAPTVRLDSGAAAEASGAAAEAEPVRSRAAGSAPGAGRGGEGEPAGGETQGGAAPAADPPRTGGAPAQPPGERADPPASLPPPEPRWEDNLGGSGTPVGVAGGCVVFDDGSRDCALIGQLTSDALDGRELSPTARWLLAEAAAQERREREDPPASGPEDAETGAEPAAPQDGEAAPDPAVPAAPAGLRSVPADGAGEPADRAPSSPPEPERLVDTGRLADTGPDIDAAPDLAEEPGNAGGPGSGQERDAPR